MRYFTIALIFFIYANSLGSTVYTFAEIIESLKSHHSVESIQNQAKSLLQEAKSKGSWGDPNIKIAAKNYSVKSLDHDNSMAAIEVGISQKISLTGKYANIKDSLELTAKAKKISAQDRQRKLTRLLWVILIKIRELKKRASILQENSHWIDNILQISSNIYIDGKITKQALLDIQIRKSQLKAQLSNNKFEIAQQFDKLSYLLKNKAIKINQESIPWHIVDGKQQYNESYNDYKEKSLQAIISAKGHMIKARKMAIVPDLNLQLSYIRRPNIDDKNFISVAVAFSLPLSGQKYADYSQIVHEKTSIVKQLKDYRQMKNSELDRLMHTTAKINEELKIIDETINFAQNSKTITAQSYSVGDSTYVELLQSELKLQKLLLRKNMLKAKLSTNNVAYKYLIGEKLYE